MATHRRVAVTALVVVLGATTLSSAMPAAAREPRRCNGSAELCRRRLDEVAFAATHNSMASEADGFQSPTQAGSISDQLAAGIRGFLIDVYTGTPTTDHICTDPTPLKVAQIEREQGRAAVDQLLAIRDQQCPPAGGPDAALYLCHNFCELGATPLADELANLRRFLKRNPNDVVVLVLEDYSPASDIATAFRKAKLADTMVDHRPGAPWPTLGKLTRSGKQLVVLTQNQGGEAPGLLDAFTEMNETPYTFASTGDFSCAPNRGPEHAGLFLLNHWINATDARAAAREANAEAVLAARAKQCMQERGHLPNLVAVNFAEEGDLLRVVDELNGVG